MTLLEWIDPLHACGHWTPELVSLAGGIEGHGVRGGRSRRIAWSEVIERLPGFADLPCVRQGRVFVVDGDAYFSRSGPRLVESLELLGHLLHPTLVPSIDVPFQRYPG